MTVPAATPSAVVLWEAIADELRQSLAAPTYSAWFGRASGRSLQDEELAVEVPNEFVRSWISGHFMELVTAAALTAHGAPLQVSLVVETAVTAAPAIAAALPEPTVDSPAVPLPVASTAAPAAHDRLWKYVRRSIS